MDGMVKHEDGSVTLDLRGCARCGGEGHEQITFSPLTRRVDYRGVTASHWAPCPENGEPVLMFFADWRGLPPGEQSGSE